ncbi:MAG: anti-sigma factor family protein, partial [Halofilum sp. (in: g-proteobacteria)]
MRTEHLTAYAEGRLPPGSALRDRVERHLHDHPEDAARIRQYRRQDALLHEVFDRVLEEPLPGRVLSATSRPAKRSSRAIAGVAAALVIGIGVGWTAARLIPEPGGQPALEGFVERVGERIARSPNLPVQS